MKYLPVSPKGQALHSSGQAILLVLLSMAVALTVVLSVLSRSLTDIKLASQSEASQRAFSAAEAGIEQALVGGTLDSGDLGNNSKYLAEITGYFSGSPVYVSPQSFLSGDRAFVWFVAHNEDGDLVCDSEYPCFKGSEMKVCWGETGTVINDFTPALEVSIFYTTTPANFTNFSQAKIARAALDPNTSRALGNGFSSSLGSSGTCQLQDESFQFQKTLKFGELDIPSSTYQAQGGLLFAILRLLYNESDSHKVGLDVTGGTNLPSQGAVITSLGTSGEANRKIKVIQSVGELPPVFADAVFSLESLSK